MSQRSKRFGFSVMSAVTNRGSARWMVYNGALNATLLIQFMARLLKQAGGRKVYLILDNLRVQHSEPVKEWLALHPEQIAVQHLPSYSPELNPDERLNRALMDSYRAEKKAALTVSLPDEDAEIEPVPVTGGGRKSEPEMDRLSNILKTFNDQLATLFNDADRVRKRISEDIAPRVATDTAYVNAKKNSGRQNARIEHDKALLRVMTALLKDDTELFKQFSDNESFRRWLTDTVFQMTYQ